MNDTELEPGESPPGPTAPPPPHALSLVVWDTPSPAVVGEPVTVRVGGQCESGCNLLGQRVTIEREGVFVAAHELDRELESGSATLYWTAASLPALAATGVTRFTARCSPEGLAHDHLPAEQAFGFPVDVKPDNRVSVRVVREDTGEVCGAVEVRLGRYEAYTDQAGEARFHVPKGTYAVTLRRLGLQAEPVQIAVDRDMTLELLAQRGETREELEARLSQMENRPWA